MPIEGTTSLDLNLGQSLRDLKQLKKNLKYDIAFWYCDKDDDSSVAFIKPKDVIERIKEKKTYKMWYSSEPINEKLNRRTLCF